ncbi:hypothetical protein C8J57DRAFT_661980 [Mycena rebaudengoi]|nr:hypothetical protein C8J57DRAFT_661980 [Mycena rebaudengoi]
MKVDDNCPVPLTPTGLTFFDVTPSSGVLGTLIDAAGVKKALTEVGVLEMAIEHLTVQPQNILDALLTRIIPRLLDLSSSAINKLRSMPFVSVRGSSDRVPPSRIINPRSRLAALYEGEPGVLPAGLCGQERHLNMLISSGFFLSDITAEVILERVRYLSQTRSEAEYAMIFTKAKVFLQLLDDHWVAWIPDFHCVGLSPSEMVAHSPRFPTRYSQRMSGP